MEQETFLAGGVALFHSVVDGKHCYEVDKVLTSKPSNFGRKGDKLMMINDLETQHLSPQTLARMLSSRSPILTMHQASVDETHNTFPKSENMRPYQKEKTVLNFSLNMVNEACLDKDPQVPEECEWKSNDKEGDSFTNKDMLLVSMTNTSVAIMQARGCDAQNPCNSCGSSGCTLNDLVVVAKQSTVTSASSVCREYIEKNFEKGQVLIQSLLQKTITPENILHPRKGIAACCTSSSTTEDITIYYYRSNAKDDFDKGVPVILNFSHSTNFLKCIWKNDKPFLTVECYEKSNLQSINKGDPNTWPFVFYMKTTKENHRRFESAAYCGWFIHTKQNGLVCVDAGTDYTESHFYIIIHLGNN